MLFIIRARLQSTFRLARGILFYEGYAPQNFKQMLQLTAEGRKQAIS